MELYELAMPVLQLIASREVSVMALFTSYINDRLGYELFCRELPLELFYMLKSDIEGYLELHDALKDSGILEQGVRNYIQRSLENYDMWVCFLDGTRRILTNPCLPDLLSADALNIARGLFSAFEEGLVNEHSWDVLYQQLCAESTLQIHHPE